VTRAGEVSFEASGVLPPLHAHVTAALAVFADAARAAVAEGDNEVLIEAEVPAVAPPETTAAAHAQPARLAVFMLSKNNVHTIRCVIGHLAAENRTHGIILTRAALTPFSRTLLAADAGPTCNPAVEHFLLSELQGCIANHVLVPRHVPLAPEERARVRERYRGAKLPRLDAGDPMARFLGLRCGDMVSVWEAFGREQPTHTVFEVCDRE
jgi:DNA-directed RNA polymerase I, II, and III subunit RPABC1